MLCVSRLDAVAVLLVPAGHFPAQKQGQSRAAPLHPAAPCWYHVVPLVQRHIRQAGPCQPPIATAARPCVHPHRAGWSILGRPGPPHSLRPAPVDLRIDPSRYMRYVPRRDKVETFRPHPFCPATLCVGRLAAVAVLLLPAGHFPAQKQGQSSLGGTTWCLWSNGTLGRLGPGSRLSLLPPDHAYIPIEALGQSWVVLGRRAARGQQRGTYG